MKKILKMRENLNASIDIGTNKIKAAIGINFKERTKIIGIGTYPSIGVHKGTIVNITSVVECIKKAYEEAELMAGVKNRSVLVNVSDINTKSINTHGVVNIKKEVKFKDIENAKISAKNLSKINVNDFFLHIVDKNYSIDGQNEILNPLGMIGNKLKVNVHIIFTQRTNINNIAKCIFKAGLRPVGFIASHLASSISVLSEDEKQMGVALVDMGAGVSKIVIFLKGGLYHTAVIPVGGTHFINDVAVGLRISFKEAQGILEKYGCALPNLVHENEKITLPTNYNRKSRTIFRRNLCEIIEPRAEETMNLIYQEIAKNNLSDKIGAGLVLTGGLSKLEGLLEMSEFLFELPIRKGYPQEVEGLSDIVSGPDYSTLLGMLNFNRFKDYYFLSQNDDLIYKEPFLVNMKHKIEEMFK